nr:MAG: rep protein [Cressdnaviricota sp.]
MSRRCNRNRLFHPTLCRKRTRGTGMKYVATISQSSIKEHQLVRLLQLLDLHEAYIGREVGTRGFKHYQCCIDCGSDLHRFNTEHNLGWHIEDCISWNDSKNYCRKTDNYRYLGDSIEEREDNGIRARPANITDKRKQNKLKKQ